MTFEWLGSLVAAGAVTATVTAVVINFVGRRKDGRNGKCAAYDKVCQTCHEVGELGQTLAKLESLPGKADKTNELLSEIKGHLAADR
jgi:cytochrome c5